MSVSIHFASVLRSWTALQPFSFLHNDQSWRGSQPKLVLPELHWIYFRKVSFSIIRAGLVCCMLNQFECLVGTLAILLRFGRNRSLVTKTKPYQAQRRQTKFDTLPPSFSHPRFPAGTKRTRAFTLPIDESWDFRQGVFLQWQYSLWIVVLKAHVATCLGHFLNFLHNCLLLVILTCSELLNVQTGVMNIQLLCASQIQQLDWSCTCNL